jgi:hypothetical protein
MYSLLHLHPDKAVKQLDIMDIVWIVGVSGWTLQKKNILGCRFGVDIKC